MLFWDPNTGECVVVTPDGGILSYHLRKEDEIKEMLANGLKEITE
jgi:hypothetical protein